MTITGSSFTFGKQSNISHADHECQNSVVPSSNSRDYEAYPQQNHFRPGQQPIFSAGHRRWFFPECISLGDSYNTNPKQFYEKAAHFLVQSDRILSLSMLN
jgi:hypothetical protein